MDRAACVMPAGDPDRVSRLHVMRLVCPMKRDERRRIIWHLKYDFSNALTFPIAVGSARPLVGTPRSRSATGPFLAAPRVSP